MLFSFEEDIETQFMPQFITKWTERNRHYHHHHTQLCPCILQVHGKDPEPVSTSAVTIRLNDKAVSFWKRLIEALGGQHRHKLHSMLAYVGDSDDDERWNVDDATIDGMQRSSKFKTVRPALEIFERPYIPTQQLLWQVHYYLCHFS